MYSAIFLSTMALVAALGYWLYRRQLWANIIGDQKLVGIAFRRVEDLARDWPQNAQDERYVWLDNARRAFRNTSRSLAKNAPYKVVRAYLDDAMLWLARLLIADEPEFLQDLFGEERTLIRHLFWSWSGSMAWDGVPPIKEQYVLRKIRLALYQEIKVLTASKLLDESVLEAARACLKKRDFPGKTKSEQQDAERVYIFGALRALRSRRDEVLQRKA